MPEKKKALRFNQGKLDLSYMLEFPRAMALFCNICTFGEHKYERGNFKLGGKPDLEYYKSLMRHIQDAFDADAESWDDDSGLHHLGHAMWNIAALIQLNLKDEDTMRFGSQAEFMEYCKETQEKYRAMREAAEKERDSGLGGSITITSGDKAA
jgi:hypothetical protein